jgi:hypothetical protein
VSERGWQREFEDSITLPDGLVLVTLRDAASYITGLPKKEAALPEWQAAIEALMLVVDHGGPTMFARIATVLAKQLVDSHDVELWSGDRFVIRIDHKPE